MRKRRSLACAAIVATVWGCAEASSRPATSRDSVGIEIVDNGRLPDRLAYRLGEPLYRVGWETGDRLWQRIQSGALLTDGRAAIADAGSRQVVVLSPSGAVDAVLGGAGQGPGEFSYLKSIHHLGGDTILAEDPNTARATVFHGREVIRSERVHAAVFAAMTSVSTDGAGGLILVSDGYWPFTEEPWVGGALARYDLMASRTDTLVRFDYRPGRRRGETVNVLQPRGWAAASPRHLVTSRSDRTQVERYALDGRLVQLMRWDQERRPFDDGIWSDFEAYQRRFRTPSPQVDEALILWRSAAEGPVPYSSRILVDVAGNVWVGEYTADPAYPPRYRVFSESGLFRGFVVMPARFEVLDLAPGFVLGVHRDELDVAAIALYRLE